jgi:peptidoglycan/xylan/chitin deacetylase (PgdA/CDA1 family)
MTDLFAGYVFDRSLKAKVRRRLVQWIPARPKRVSPQRPIVTFTFDDFPQSAATIGAPLLEEAGVRGTFYACAQLAGTEGAYGRHFDADDIARLQTAGHEIGCHSFEHLDCAQADVQAITSSLSRNGQACESFGVDQPLESFAFPYGEAGFAAKRALPAHITSARGIFGGLNHGLADFAQLRAQKLYGEGSIERALALIGEAKAKNGWAILFTHDVSESPSAFGTSPASLKRLLAAAHGCDVLTMRDAVAHLEGKL